MRLLESIRGILLEDLTSQIAPLKDKYVGDGKPMTEKDFVSILNAANNKFYLISWLAKKVGSNIIKPEDIYKWKEYFDIFEKNKNKFQHKDIHLYKTDEDVKNFLDKVIEIREGDIKFDETQGKDNYVSKNDIEKLEATEGIKYLGMFDGYQVFQIFKVAKDVWKLYRDILGRCKGRARGAKIDICTIAHYSYFKNYLTDPKGSSYFLLYNLEDPKSPYQLHYESGQFMDKNDSEIIKIDQIRFFEFIGKLVPRYSLDQENFPGSFEIPVKGKGFQDEKKRKQGIWKNYENGRIESISTYLNDKRVGPFVDYHDNGKIYMKGSHHPKGYYDGEFSEFDEDGNIIQKGTLVNDKKVGVWYERTYGNPRITDYSKTPIEVSGFTKDDKLRYVTYKSRPESSPSGELVVFYPSGSVKAIGKLGVNGDMLGDYVGYFPDGRIQSQGKFVRGQRQGEWTDILKNKKGKKFILVANFWRNIPEGKIKIFDIEGNYLKSVSPKKINTNYWKYTPNLQSFRD